MIWMYSLKKWYHVECIIHLLCQCRLIKLPIVDLIKERKYMQMFGNSWVGNMTPSMLWCCLTVSFVSDLAFSRLGVSRDWSALSWYGMRVIVGWTALSVATVAWWYITVSTVSCSILSLSWQSHDDSHVEVLYHTDAKGTSGKYCKSTASTGSCIGELGELGWAG